MKPTYWIYIGLAAVVLLILWYFNTQLTNIANGLSNNTAAASTGAAGDINSNVTVANTQGIGSKNIIADTSQGSFSAVITQAPSAPSGTTKVNNATGSSSSNVSA